MIDIKQEELDKRFVDGVLTVESALFKSKLVTDIDKAAQIVHDILQTEIGPQRLSKFQGKEDIRT